MNGKCNSINLNVRIASVFKSFQKKNFNRGQHKKKIRILDMLALENQEGI